MELRSLTRAETEIMKILWKLEKAFIKDILVLLPDPKPAYNTVATFVRILEKKKVIDHITYGNTHQYFPVITEEEFKRHEIQQLMANYFDNSVSNLVSFFVNENNIKEKEFEELRDFIKRNTNK
jgi:BlaI family penicillinase repressor